MKTIFDVGANDGESTLKMAEGNLIYAFEPTPELCEIIEKKITNFPKYHLIPVAVSNYEGKATFNVAGQKDWGCSSLNTFSDDLDKTWIGRTDFKVTHQIGVEVIRLDNFIERHGIEEIDYFHCDAQGSDLQVLEGMGKYLRIIKEGVIEVAANKELALYKEGDNTLLTAIKFLTDNGFRDLHITPWANEYNIYFKRTECLNQF